MPELICSAAAIRRRLAPNAIVIGAAAALAAVTLAGCAAPGGEVVQASSRPTVSYAYTSDSELGDISQRALDYCRNVGGTPRSTNVVSRGTRERVITYECDPAGAPAAASTVPPVAAAPPPPDPGIAYTYRTDQELIAATRSAEAQCRQRDARPRAGNISINADGSKIVRFSCERPL